MKQVVQLIEYRNKLTVRGHAAVHQMQVNQQRINSRPFTLQQKKRHNATNCVHAIAVPNSLTGQTKR